MTLTTHMVIAAAVTKSFARTHPILGFFAAIASHYLSDAIPHWDYQLHAMQGTPDEAKEHWDADKARIFRRKILRDIRMCAVDGLAGAAITLALIRPATPSQWWWAGVVIVGGALPDFLQGLYLSGLKFLAPLQYLHDHMHTKIKLGAYPAIGIPFQAIILLTAAYFLL